MDGRRLGTLLAVIRHGSLAAAARVLGFSQPTVTLHIQELERELGLPLFERANRRLVLNENGRLVARHAQHILESIDALRSEVGDRRRGIAGAVNIGVIEPTATVHFPRILSSLARAYPGVRLRIDVGSAASVSRRVADSTLHFGVSTAPDDPLLSFEPLFEEELVLAAPPKSSIGRLKSVQVEHLMAESVLVTAAGCAYRRAIEQGLAQSGAAIPHTHEIASISALIESVRAGLGIGLVPHTALRKLPPGIAVRRIEGLRLSVSVGLLKRMAKQVEPGIVIEAAERIRNALTRVEVGD